MFGIFRRIGAALSGARGVGQGGRRKTSPGARSRNGAGGKRRLMVRDSDRTGSVPPARVAKAPPSDRSSYVEQYREGIPVTGNTFENNVVCHDNIVPGKHVRLSNESVAVVERGDMPQELVDAHRRTASEIEALQQAAYNQIRQHSMNQEAAFLGMQRGQQGPMNQLLGLEQQMRQVSGMGQDPLRGVPQRNVPYWKAMYGNLGMGGQHFRGGK